MSLWSTSQSKHLWMSGDQWSFSSSLSHSGPSGSLNPSCGCFPVPEFITGIYILNSQQNSHIDSLPVAIMVGKARWEPLELPLPGKIVNQKQYCIAGGITEIRTTIENLKDSGIVIPTTSPFIQSIWLVHKTDGGQRMTVDYCKLNHVMISITATVSDVISLLEQINTFTGTQCAAVDLANAFFFIFVQKAPKSVSLQLAR